ncbi:hypothetical protein V6U90_16130 [Micromonospora sp. CPCC 206060]|uniref:hypothetical protein n=1 Tax=Micromonospora sp. CPCC 206060 TaxID=3122406 RepID=UPI002FEF400A
MDDPEKVLMSKLAEGLAAAGIVLDKDFVRLELSEDVLTLHRLARTPVGMPARMPDGSAQVTTTTIPVVTGDPDDGPSDPPSIDEPLADR